MLITFAKYTITDVWQGTEYALGSEYTSNSGHNILRLSDVLQNFPFTTSEVKHDYH